MCVWCARVCVFDQTPTPQSSKTKLISAPHSSPPPTFVIQKHSDHPVPRPVLIKTAEIRIELQSQVSLQISESWTGGVVCNRHCFSCLDKIGSWRKLKKTMANRMANLWGNEPSFQLEEGKRSWNCYDGLTCRGDSTTVEAFKKKNGTLFLLKFFVIFCGSPLFDAFTSKLKSKVFYLLFRSMACFKLQFINFGQKLLLSHNDTLKFNASDYGKRSVKN